MTKRTILVADDEIADAVAVSLEDKAREHNIFIETATDGAECLRKVVANPPDLILLDIELPVINGFEVLEELRTRDVATRVVMFSGSHTDIDTALRCVRSGACDYIIKNRLEPNVLLERLRKHLLLESAINLKLSKLSAPAEALVQEAARLDTEYRRIKEENQSLRLSSGGRILLEVVQKFLYALISAAAVALLVKAEVVSSGWATALVYIFLFLLLMVPIEKIRRISGKLGNLGADVVVDK